MKNSKLIIMTVLLVNFSFIKSFNFLNSILPKRKRVYKYQKKNSCQNYYKRRIKRLENELKFIKDKNEKLKIKNFSLKSNFQKHLSFIQERNRNFGINNLILKKENLRLKWKIKSLKKKNTKKNKSDEKKKKNTKKNENDDTKNFFHPLFNNSFSEFKKKEKKHFFAPFHNNISKFKMEDKDDFFFN